MKPSVLVDTYSFVVGIRTQNLLELALAGRWVECDLVVQRQYVALSGEYPNLQELHHLVAIGVEFAVLNSRSGAHHLHIAFFDDAIGAHAVAVTQIPLEWNRNDLHILVRMSSKAHSGLNFIVVEYAKHAESHAIGIIVVRKDKGVVCIEPTVVGVSARIGAM